MRTDAENRRILRHCGESRGVIVEMTRIFEPSRNKDVVAILEAVTGEGRGKPSTP